MQGSAAAEGAQLDSFSLALGLTRAEAGTNIWKTSPSAP